ncbi:MAG: M20/M25/M40 family metallo-hydrolase [Sulfolobales archaeon]
MKDPRDLLKMLIPLKCVNDPTSGMKPGAGCVRGVEDVMRLGGMDPKVMESGGFYTFYEVYGSGKPVVLYLAHYDVVPPGPSWSSDPFTPREAGGRLYGRGSADDLGNVAVLISASGSIANIVERYGGTAIIAFTGDEEIGGYNGARVLREYLRSRGLFPSYMINADGSGLVIINRRRNAFKITLEARVRPIGVRGSIERITKSLVSRSYHAAYFIPGSDVHPLIDLAREVVERELLVSRLGGEFVKSNVLPQRVWADVIDLRGDGEATADLGLMDLLKAVPPITRISTEMDFPSIYGITATPNVYSFTESKHVLEIDVRAPLKDHSRLERVVKQIIEDLELDLKVSVSGGGGYLNTHKSSRIVAKAFKTLEKIGLRGSVAERAGASDSRYFSPEGVEAIDFGPVGGNIHGPDEYVELWSLDTAKLFYVGLLEELLSKDLSG